MLRIITTTKYIPVNFIVGGCIREMFVLGLWYRMGGFEARREPVGADENRRELWWWKTLTVLFGGRCSVSVLFVDVGAV